MLMGLDPRQRDFSNVIYRIIVRNLDFAGGLVVKNLPVNAMDSIPESGPPWSRKRQPTPVFSPGKSHGQRRMVGYSP